MEQLPGYDSWKTRAPEDEDDDSDDGPYECAGCGSTWHPTSECHELTRYHFDIGNTVTGAIGMCAAVYAHTRKEALSILQARLDDFSNELATIEPDSARIEYIQVYISPENITEEDVDEPR